MLEISAASVSQDTTTNSGEFEHDKNTTTGELESWPKIYHQLKRINHKREHQNISVIFLLFSLFFIQDLCVHIYTHTVEEDNRL